ncbi:MAG: hypothetical protein AAF810_08055 [Cyanobacteria bacterium P01_D01_bin.36]
MSATTTKTINWDAILEDYGNEAKINLKMLLVEHRIDDDDPVAALIASMFISHMDTLRAFNSINSVIEDGKDSLSTEFKEQIVALRGIVSFAQEHLIEAGKEQLGKREDELLTVVKEGIKQALLRSEAVTHARTTGGLLVSVLIASVVASIAGIGGVLLGRSMVPNEVVAPTATSVEMTTEWQEIQANNSDILKVCLENWDTLNGKCIIEINPPE